MSSGQSKDVPDTGGRSSQSNKYLKHQDTSSEQVNEKKPLMTLTSDEVNYLIFRYMQESGFVHSAFTFSHESMLSRTSLRTIDKTLPPGALLTFLQKGLQYLGVEESLRQQQDNSKKTSNPKKSGNAAGVPASLTTNQGIENSLANNGDFSLLSSVAIAAITRRNPPIVLTVPPAAAAAAVKARLAAEAKLPQQRQLHDTSDGHNGLSTLSAVARLGVNPPSVVEAPIGFVASASMLESTESLVTQSADGLLSHRNDTTLQSEVQHTEIQESTFDDRTIFGHGGQSGLPHQESALNSHSFRTLMQQSDSTSNKRSAAEAKRSLKKQKTAKNGEPQLDISDNATNTVFEGAMLGESVTKSEAKNQHEEWNLKNVIDGKRSAVVSHAFATSLNIGHENDRPGDPIEISPAHSGQITNPLPVPALSLTGNGEIFDRSRNGEYSTHNATFQPIFESNGNELEVTNASSQDTGDDDPFATKEDEILTLNKHQSEVFMCAWNPKFTNLIATGSGDASARIWEMNDNSAKAGLKGCKLLPHGIDTGDRKNKDVTTLEWSSEGTLLATGSYDGVARVWDRNGALIYTLHGHEGPIFSLKWNNRGNFLLSGSYDKTIIVWNISAGGTSGCIQNQFKDHDAPALDVDWRDNMTFASCSTDRTVHIYRVNRDSPIKIFNGHTDEVNEVKWDYSGRFLASCSDDCTAKVWDVDSERTDALHDFVSHNQEVYTVRWSPTGPGSPHPQKIPLLATASFDGSIRLWNIQDGSCWRFFDQHRDSVYSVAFSPSGDFLASGSLAGQMYIWNIEENRYVKSYKGKGDIFEVAWNKEETRIAACFSSNVVAVIDFDASKLPKLS